MSCKCETASRFTKEDISEDEIEMDGTITVLVQTMREPREHGGMTEAYCPDCGRNYFRSPDEGFYELSTARKNSYMVPGMADITGLASIMEDVAQMRAQVESGTTQFAVLLSTYAWQQGWMEGAIIFGHAWPDACKLLQIRRDEMRAK